MLFRLDEHFDSTQYLNSLAAMVDSIDRIGTEVNLDKARIGYYRV